MAKQDQNIESIYPLSPMQQGMLFHSLLAPKSGVYLNQILYTLTGNLEAGPLVLAWQQAVDRHEPLRTLFVWEGQEKPLQVVRRRASLPWEDLDWRGISAEQQALQLAAFLKADRRRGFDLTKAPLARLTLIRMDDSRYEMVWSHHHLLLDGWSSFLVLKDVMSLYPVLKDGREFQLEPLRSYRNYIQWLQGQDITKAEGFWRAALKGFTAPTPLLGHQIDEAQKGADYESADMLGCSSSSLMASLRSFGNRHNLTLNTLVQGAWAILLSRYSGEEDIVFGSTVSGRPAELAGVESMVGLFINTLPVRAYLSPKDLVLDWLKAFQNRWVELRQHEQTPLLEIKRRSDVRGDQPLFESVLVFQNYPVDASVWGQEAFLKISNIRGVEPTNFPLTLLVVPKEELEIKVQYDPRRFDAAAIARMLGHFQTLLEGMISNSDGRLSDLPLLTDAERQQLLLDWNKTEIAYPRDRCLHELFEERAGRTPDAMALVFEDTQLTYRELNERANQLAHRLQKLGVGPDTLVGICIKRSLDLIVGVLGILKAGGACVPLDPAYPRERLEFMLADAGAALVVTQHDMASGLSLHSERTVCLNGEGQIIAPAERENPVSAASAKNLAYVLYTSGSTGKPKGVAMPHGPLVNLVSWQVQNSALGLGAKTLQFASLNFDVSFQEIFSTLGCGGTLVLVDESLRQDADGLWRYLVKEGIERLFLPMVGLQQLAEVAESRGLVPSSLREVITAGEQLRISSQILWLFRQLHDCRLYNQYGPTESHVVTAYALPVSPDQWPALPPIGRPIANARIHLLDRHLQPVPVGVAGEIYIGGEVLARGYHNRPELTAERFIADRFSHCLGARLYKTGDLARYLPDGTIQFLGRNDDQVKIRGFRIELGEIESALARHPALGDVAVVMREHVPGDKRLIAYLTAKDGKPPAVSELRALLRAKLPEYMVPSAFVTLDRFPLTPSGKVDRKALPVPDNARPELESRYVAPTSPTEKTLAAIWCEILRLKQVGVHDNFFDLGGHSLVAIRLTARIGGAFAVDLPLRALFEHPTLSGLADQIETLLWARDQTSRSDPAPALVEGQL